MEPQRLTGEILVSERLASRSLVAAALRWQLRARMDAVYRLRDALVRFHVRRSERTRAFGSLLTPRDFLHGRSRARVELELPLSRESEVRRRDAYRLLGLAVGADADAVKRAFRRLAPSTTPTATRIPQHRASELVPSSGASPPRITCCKAESAQPRTNQINIPAMHATRFVASIPPNIARNAKRDRSLRRPGASPA